MHDPTVPSTTACPYLPGQTVNTMNVPMERSLRQRSASLNSMRQFNYKTMNPEAKFITPRPAPPAPSLSDSTNLPTLRHGSAPTALHHHSSSQSLSTRSLSPAPVWRRLFTRKLSSRDLGRTTPSHERDDQDNLSIGSSHGSEEPRSRSLTPSEGIRTRDMSPESLRKFLSDDLPTRPDSNMSERPALVIPEEIAEENEDDDNFATSAVSESQAFPTSLSPPPFQRTASSDTIASSLANSSCHTIVPIKMPVQPDQPQTQTQEAAHPSDLPRLETDAEPACFYSASSSAVTSPVSPHSAEAELELTSFYDSTEDDDDILSSTGGDSPPYQALPALPSLSQNFSGYSLPRERDHDKTSAEVPVAFPTAGSNFLGSHVDTGLDDFATELGWMVETIGTRAD